MNYILNYLGEVQFIQPVPGAEVKTIEEYANSDCPGIGRRLVINDKETDIVVWYADYDAWLEEKFDKLQEDYHKLMRMLPTPELDDNKQSSDQ